MFYGGGGRDDAGRGGNRNPNRNDRYEQMTKQQQLIENKKQEIQKRLEEERHKKTMEALLMGSKPSTTALGSSSSSSTSSPAPASSRQKSSHSIKSEDGSTANALPFANDGSFLDKFRKLQEEKIKEKEKEVQVKAEVKEELNEYGSPYGSVPRPPLPPSLKVIDPNSMTQNINHAGHGGGMYNNNNNAGGSMSYSQHNYYGNAPPPPPPPRPPHHRMTPPPLQHQQYNMGYGYQNAPPPPPPPPPPHPSKMKTQQFQPPQSYTHRPPQNYSQAPPPPPQQKPSSGSGFPSEKVKQLAAQVAEGGDVVEHMTRINNKDDPLFWFLFRPDSAEYGRYRDLVTHLKFESMPPSPPPPPPPPPPIKPLLPPKNMAEPSSELEQQQTIKRPAPDEDDDAGKKRRSRWGPQSTAVVPPPTTTPIPEVKEEDNLDNSLHPSLLGTTSEPPPPPLSVAYPVGGIKQESGTSPSFQNFGEAGGAGGVQIPPPGVNFSPNVNINLKGPPPMLTRVTRTNPQLLAYAKQSYGTVDLDDEQWKQCEEAYKMNLLFQDIARKKAKDEQMALAGKFKHEYDSDEEVDDGGTWEHKQRMKEMEKTKDWAQELTQKAKGKHHIGDFLPPEELGKFMDKYKAVKEGRQMDESAYQDFKIAQDNVGFKLLQKMGWNDGQGLGSSGQGITAPIDKGVVVSDKQGLGVEKPSELNEEDDEYAAYRKRMMLAYRFRPNPLNNPRRAYY